MAVSFSFSHMHMHTVPRPCAVGRTPIVGHGKTTTANTLESEHAPSGTGALTARAPPALRLHDVIIRVRKPVLPLARSQVTIIILGLIGDTQALYGRLRRELEVLSSSMESEEATYV